MTCSVPNMISMVSSTPRPVKRKSRCQQAVEKALKAYLFSRHVELIRTHILPRLLARCVDFDQDFRQMEAACDLPTDYYAAIMSDRFDTMWRTVYNSPPN